MPNKKVIIPDCLIAKIKRDIHKGITVNQVWKKYPIAQRQVLKIRKTMPNLLPFNSKLKDPTYYKAIESKKDFIRLKRKLYFMAYKYVMPREQIDELVNEIWLQGSVQRCKDERIENTAIYTSILKYRQNRDFTKSSKKFKANKHAHIEDVREKEGFIDCEGICHNGFEKIDYLDTIERLEVGFDRKDRFIITLRFVDGMTLEEIAQAVGCGVSHISNRLLRFKKIARKRVQEAKDSLGLFHQQT